MTIPILVEPSAMGFAATTGGPLDLSAEAASAQEAVHALQEKIAARLERGAMILDQAVPSPRPPVPITPLAENPLFEEWLAAVERFRADQENREGAGPGEAP